MERSFVHLHLHTQYSLLDGAIRIAALPGALQQRGYGACAITDHGNLFGAVEFSQTLKKAGLKPIVGIEAYVADGHRSERKYDRPGPNAAHLVLLCQNRQGYQNLIKLSSLAYTEGKYYGVPRMDRELLERYNGGLIALSSCLGGVINRPLMRGDDEAAAEAARWYGQVFDGRFYVEIQEHGIDKQGELNPKLLAIAGELGLPLVGTNDCHYLEPDEAYAHWILQLMGWQRKVTDPGAESFQDKRLWLKSPEEMAETMAAYPPEVYENAARIAEQCDLSLENSRICLPRYDIPQDFDEAGWFRKCTQEGLERRLAALETHYGIQAEAREEFRRTYSERLEYELGVIVDMDYAGYFLIVADFINWAKDNGVRVGPGRGSGAGSLVAYALRVTDLDPIRHGLLFERFLNPERVSLPDFDIDFDVAGRDRVIDYVRGKYGAEKVCQISTFGTLGAKAALRGVARVLDFPYSEADKIAKLIPNKLGITLQEAIEMEPELARLEREGSDREQQLIRHGKALEGLNHTLSTHAAGVIIMDTDIREVMPICTAAKGDAVQSQYTMKSAEDQGAVKFDFLGLLNLTIIGEALRLIDAGKPPEARLDIDRIPLDDAETYAMLGRGEATGVFQLESGGMRRLVMDMKPNCFEDIVAVLALFRPGPLGSGMVTEFVERKKKIKPIEYPHPLLEPVLRETYGVMVYQEQVIQAVQVLAGFSLGQADILRRAIGKKNPEELAKQRERFVAGCGEREIPADKAHEIFDLIDYFSGYGFNKSHSAAYGLIAYQTAYLKAHHPVEFMAALLSSDMDNTDKVVNFITECREMDVPVLPPDINASVNGFTVHGGAIRFGLNAVKNVGENAVEVILMARAEEPGGRFADLAAFVKAVDLHRVNKRVMEALVKCGAFDSLEPNRARFLAGLEELMSVGLQFRNSHVEGQESLFDYLPADEAAKTDLIVELPEVPDLRPRQRLKLEKEALGFYISGHPLDGYGSEIGTVAVSSLELREGNHADGAEVTVAGVVGQLTVRLTRNAEKMAVLRLQDQRGSIEVAVFPRIYAEAAPLLA
ncbi:MAG: DNA polymerase III subunit alpha, partial [SAR324 cluster bacterium]|nr:DNA polymerase III subunit alpha [SAR324 cluster bacterium]